MAGLTNPGRAKLAADELLLLIYQVSGIVAPRRERGCLDGSGA